MDGEIRVITQNDQMVTQALGGLRIADWGLRIGDDGGLFPIYFFSNWLAGRV
jgi:hypothetical protein